MWKSVGLVAAVLVVAWLAGPGGKSGSDEPMATDGPNQVVVKVPGMT